MKFIQLAIIEYSISEAKIFGGHRAEYITISTDEYESIKYTIEILSDSEHMEQIMDSKADYISGNYKNIRDLLHKNPSEN